MMLQIVNPNGGSTQLPDSPAALMNDWRTSVEAVAVTWALVQADFALKGRTAPARINDLHHGERRKYEDVAVTALLMMNRDAELYAENSAADTAYTEFHQFCNDHDLDWLDDDNPVNEDDALETLIHRCALKAVQRFRQTLSGVWPGLSQHLAKLDRMRQGNA